MPLSDFYLSLIFLLLPFNTLIILSPEQKPSLTHFVTSKPSSCTFTHDSRGDEETHSSQRGRKCFSSCAGSDQFPLHLPTRNTLRPVTARSVSQSRSDVDSDI